MSYKNILLWLMVIIWIVIIFILSAMPARESSSRSKLVIDKSMNIVTKITNRDISANDIKIIVNKVNPVFRKAMHVFVYFILSILLLMALNTTNISRNKMYIMVILLCVIYAISDEYHQTMVLGRCGRLKDILIDTGGSVIGLLLYLFIYSKRKI